MERTHAAQPAGPTVAPVYEMKETPEAYGLTVFLPGVSKDGLQISIDHEALTITGSRIWQRPEKWTTLYRESTDAPFELVIAHANAINRDRTVAELNDGVLRVSLPKAEAIKPRKIPVS